METAVSNITVLPSNRQELGTFVNKAKEEILSGNESPLKIAVQLKAMEELISMLRKDSDIKEAILSEAEKYGQKSFEEYGAVLQIRECGVKHDFSVCDDSLWNDLNTMIEKLSAQKKERETLLKSIPETGMVVPETGELINKPVKTGSTTVAVKLK